MNEPTFARKSQSWSIDITIGVVVFMIAFFIVYSLLGSSKGRTPDDLQEEASQVIKEVASSDSGIKITNHNEINESRLHSLKNMSYAELKRKLGIEEDVCIYLEDERGKIIVINNSFRGIGAPTINLSGVPCSQK